MKTIKKILILLLTGLTLAGCGEETENTGMNIPVSADSSEYDDSVEKSVPDHTLPQTENETGDYGEENESAQTKRPEENSEVTGGEEADIIEIPAYSGQAYVEVNGNIPYFEDSELTAESYEYYSELDWLGRCGVCTASISQDIMPTEERGAIGSIRPSGWHTVKYTGIIDGNYLYNRCHLIGYQLAGENANTKNLITGTRYMNTEGMLPFENMVADYVKETGNHVMYRVTPIFEGENLLSDGVLMEAKSVEDNGAGILFNVFCYNVQPGIIIDYANGDSRADDSAAAEKESRAVSESEAARPESKAGSEKTQPNPETAPDTTQPETAPDERQPESKAAPDAAQSKPETAPAAEAGAYAVNNNNGKIHKVGACPATGDGENAMKSPVYFGTYEEAEAYSFSIAPGQDKRKCGNCW